MPPKIKVTKDAILDAAFQIVQEKGIAHINARELATCLNCSTQPVFRAYKNMDELKQELYQKVEEYYNKHMEDGMQNPNPFLGMGLAYISFAKEESNLFQLLFMTEHFKIRSLFDLIESEEDKAVISMIAGISGLREDTAKELYIDIWLVTHGLASMMATNSCKFEEKEIEKILSDAFYGFLNQLKKGDN